MLPETDTGEDCLYTLSIRDRDTRMLKPEIREREEPKMKIAVSSTGKNLDSPIDPRFGRCAYFVIVETEDMSYEAFENENNALSGGAGIQSAGFLSSKNVMAVMTGNCGPNAIKALSAGRINVYTGQTGTVREAILTYQKGGLIPSTQATVDEKSGMRGTGQGMGRGRGSGMGMGRGRGMGMGRGKGMV